MNYIEYILYAVPIVCVFAISFFFKMKDAGESVKFRPPPWFFGMIWPILLILLGITMSNSYTTKNKAVFILHIITVLCLMSWIVIYTKAHDKKYALWWLCLSIMIVLVMYTLTTNTTYKCLYLPLVVWASFATLMSSSEIMS